MTEQGAEIEIAPADLQGVKPEGAKDMFWTWLQKNHPIAYEVVWWAVTAAEIAAIVIAIIAITTKQ